jgi:hypothetical protein
MSSDITEQRDLEIAGITSVEAATFNGDLIVEAGAGKARLEIAITGKATYTVEPLGKLLYVAAKKRGLTYGGGGASIHLWLPTGMTFKLANVNGAIRVTGAVQSLEASIVNGAVETRSTGQGDLRLNAVGGSIEVQNAAGTVRTTFVNSAVRVSDAAGRVEAKGTSGGVRLSRITGQIQVNASGGPVWLEDVTFDPGSQNWVKIGGGAIEIAGMHAPGGLDLSAQAHMGVVHANVSGFETHIRNNRLTMRMAGKNRARVDLATGGDMHITV